MRNAPCRYIWCWNSDPRQSNCVCLKISASRLKDAWRLIWLSTSTNKAIWDRVEFLIFFFDTLRSALVQFRASAAVQWSARGERESSPQLPTNSIRFRKNIYRVLRHHRTLPYQYGKFHRIRTVLEKYGKIRYVLMGAFFIDLPKSAKSSEK